MVRGNDDHATFSAERLLDWTLFSSSNGALLCDAHRAHTAGRGFWREFSVGIGFAGLSMMGLQFFLTGRFRNITAPYGIDVVYHFHRNVSLIAFSFILLHAAIITISSPETLILLNPASVAWWMAVGAAGFLAFAIVIATSLYRIKLGLSYERWRGIHGYISVVAVMMAMAHVEGVGYYVQGYLKRGLWIAMPTA